MTRTIPPSTTKWIPLNESLSGHPRSIGEPALETYIKSVEREIQHDLDWGPTHRSNDNIRSDERKALSSLRKRTDIVIKPADKGSATVVMSKDDYLTRVMDHLDNTQFYEKLSDDPKERFSEEITSLI